MKKTMGVALTGAILATTLVLHAETVAIAVSYSLRDRGSANVETVGDSTSLRTGYARLQPNVGNTTPSGLVILSTRANGMLINEIGAAGSTAVLSGRTYGELNGPVNTAFAFANPNSFDVTIVFTLINTSGQNIRRGSFRLAANAQMAAFLDEDPFLAAPFVGTFSFEASGPVGVLALRSLLNENGESMTPQPVAILLSDPIGVVVIGHFADGGGWRTQILLVNTTDAVISGAIQFFSEGSGLVPAVPISLAASGQVNTVFFYTIAPRASAQLETAGIGSKTEVGSVRITPSGAGASPVAFAEYTLTSDGVTTTAASAPGQLPAASSRIVVESNGNFAAPLSTQNAVAITNTSTTTATATLELLDMAGASTGFTAVLSVPSLGHVSKFLNEIFPAAPRIFRGLLRVTAGSTPLSIVALRTRYNETGRFIATSIPVSNEALSANTAELLFPAIADGAGFTTQFELYSGITGQTSTGNLRFFSQTGQPLILTFP